MKKILILLSTMTLLLSACGSQTPMDEGLDPGMVATVAAEMMAATTTAQEAEAAAQATTAPTEAPTEAVPAPTLSADFENAAPIQTQLIIGIFQLENTALAITKDQANILHSQLLALQTSMTNQTTLTEEDVNTLVLQQVAVLSAEQVQVITDLQITQEIVMTAIQQLGFDSDTGGRGGEGGAPPADGTGAPPQGSSGGQGGGSAEAGTAPEGKGNRNNLVSPQLLDAIITLLGGKINS